MPRPPRDSDAPPGSAYDAAQRRRSRTPWRALRGALTWRWVGLLCRVLPPLYRLAAWLLWRRVSDGLSAPIEAALDRHGRVVSAVWHDEVLLVGMAYRRFDPYTLASAGSLGRVITAVLEGVGFRVYRGGTSRRGTRRRDRVLVHMLRYLRAQPRVYVGLTVDGSYGPRYQLKPGILTLAKALRAPIYLQRTWARPCLRLPSWDRTGVPLPGARIEQRALGPYWVDPGADKQALERLRAHLEGELLALTADVEARLAGRPGPAPGTPLGPHDLRPDDPPPWAGPGEARDS